MTNETSSTVPTAPLGSPLCRPWGFWASVAWGIAAVGAWFGVQFLVLLLLLGRPGRGEMDDALTDALTVSLVTIAAAPAAIAVVALAARMADCRVSEYLALTWPRAWEFVVGIVLLAILLPLGDLLSLLTDREVTPRFVTDLYRSARDANAVLLLALAVGVAAPLVEEIVFRGFLLPGFAARIGGAAAIVLTSAAWAAMHLQYELYHIGQVFVLGVAFGWMRWRSGSTLLPIVLHALVNLLALAQAAVLVERMA